MKKVVLLIFGILYCLSGFAQVTCSATGATGSGYPAFISAGFGIEEPDCVHTTFGPHITQTYDANLDRNIFVFHSHIVADNDRCQIFDRVRMEIKGAADTDEELKHSEDAVSFYRWKFRVDENFIGGTTFNHIFQNKAVGGSDDGFPILTLTLRADVLEFRHNGGDTGTDEGVLAEADLNLFKGKWVEAYLRQTHSENGNLEITLRDMTTGVTILEHTATELDLWRTDAEFNRPKWGMYRLKNSELQDETIRFADFCISENSETFCPAEAVLLPDIEAPTVPTDLILTDISAVDATLNWTAATDNYGVTAYDILQNENIVATVSETSAVLIDLTPATEYTFTVRAKDAANNISGLSNPVLAVTDAANILPDVTTNFSPSNGATEIYITEDLSWETGSNTDSVRVFFGTTENPPLVFTQNINDFQPNLTPATVYFWRINAVNANGETPGPLLTFTTAQISTDFPWRVYRADERPEIETDFLDLNEAPAAPPIDEIINDPNGSTNYFFSFRSNTDEEFRWRHDFSTGDSVLTIVVRLQAVSPAVNGICYFEIRNNDWRQKIRINQATIKLEKTSPIIEADLPFSLTDEMHLLRIVSTGIFTSIYLDENPVPFLEGISDTPSTDDYFEWGKSGGADYGARIDWLTLQNNVADAPDEGANLPADLFLSSNASLSELKIDGLDISGFSPDILEYIIPISGNTVPVLTWETASNLATVTIANPTEVPDTQATITVTAQDGFTTQIYVVNYLETSSTELQNLSDEIRIFPNPAQRELFIELGENQKGTVSIFNTAGQKVQGDIFIKNTKKISLSSDMQGTFFVRVEMSDGKTITKKITVE